MADPHCSLPRLNRVRLFRGYVLWVLIALLLLLPLLAPGGRPAPVAQASAATPVLLHSGSIIYNTVEFQDMLFFASNDSLYKSDGTPEGTVLVKSFIYSPYGSTDNLTVVNNTLFFTADDGTHGRELWKSDGTPEGTVMLKDIYPGVNTSWPSYFTVVNNTLFFIADDGIHGRELWKSDGTPDGTVMLKDIYPGVNDSWPSYFTVVNNTLFFSADDGIHGRELWKSDGTPDGTVMLKDIYPGTNGAWPITDGYSPSPEFTIVNNTLFFIAADGIHGYELWKSDGTSEGTVLVKDINPLSASSQPSGLFVYNNTLFFNASDGASERFWQSDGTAAGTVQVWESNLSRRAEVNGVLFLSGMYGSGLYAIGGSSVPPQPTATPTFTPLPAATATPTFTPLPAATATPTFTPLPAATATATPGTPDDSDLVQSVTPSEGGRSQATRITVRGSGFTTAPAPVVRLSSPAGLFPLTEVTVLNATSFTASVPAGLPPGLYDLIVTSGGRTGTLPNAFSVLDASPVVSQVIPTTGFNDRTTEMLVQGLNFADGAVVRLGTTPLATIRINSTTLLAVVPAGLEAGAYPLTVANPDGGQVSLPTGFTVLDAADTVHDDLFSSSDQLWLNPPVPQAGQSVQLGLLVQRSGGKQPLEGVTVAFRRDSVNGPLLGTATVPFLDPVAGSESTTPLSVTFPTAGEVTLFAIIDPDNAVVESDKTNNIVQRTVVVAPAAADQTAPVVQGIAVNGGPATTVTSRDLTLDIRASDPPPNASGVQDIHIIEYVYNEGAQRWVPVARSGWLPYTQTPDRYRWSLLPLPGMRYMQVRARDGAANVSIGNARRLINYEVPTDRIARGQTRIYRYIVAAGQELRVDLEVLSGDADLYVWSSDAQQSARVSNLPGTANEQVIVPVSEIVPGVYQVEVYGYNASEYRLTTVIGAPQTGLATLTSGGLVEDKLIPDAPVVPVSSVPDERAGSIPMTLVEPEPDTGQRVYLPLIVR